MLGVLKADVDSLGVAASAAIARGGAASLRNFSEGLDRFFSQTLEAEKNRADSPWSNIYTVFSGGDDILAVGPWDLMIDFAGHMQTLFSKQFGTGALNSPSSVPLTLCAAVAIIKPRYPVHIAAHQAEELLSHAKTKCADGAAMPKDQCAAFGDLWKWKDHARIINDGKKLADWVDAGIVQRGWLQTILELALLQCGEAGPEYENIPPATAGYKLAYHIARNWPSSGPARMWIDQVAKISRVNRGIFKLSFATRCSRRAERIQEKNNEQIWTATWSKWRAGRGRISRWTAAKCASTRSANYEVLGGLSQRRVLRCGRKPTD